MEGYSDFNSWDDWNEWSQRNSFREWKDSRPVCAYCGKPILEEFCYEFDNGDKVCEGCVSDYIWDHHRKYIG